MDSKTDKSAVTNRVNSPYSRKKYVPETDNPVIKRNRIERPTINKTTPMKICRFKMFMFSPINEIHFCFFYYLKRIILENLSKVNCAVLFYYSSKKFYILFTNCFPALQSRDFFYNSFCYIFREFSGALVDGGQSGWYTVYR